MHEPVDGERYPNLQTYLSALPDGLRSYPECRARASMLRADVASGVTKIERGVPAQLRRAINEPALPSEWIPEVINVAAHVAVYEERFGQDEDRYRAHALEVNRRLLRSPMYRVLMAVATPRMLIRGIAQRWGSLHRGTSLDATIEGKRGIAKLQFPEHLFPRTFIEGIGAGLQAAVEAAGAKEVRWEVQDLTASSALIESTWS